MVKTKNKIIHGAIPYKINLGLKQLRKQFLMLIEHKTMINNDPIPNHVLPIKKLYRQKGVIAETPNAVIISEDLVKKAREPLRLFV